MLQPAHADQINRTAVIGFAAPLTDPMVQSARDGALLAIEEANQAPSAGSKRLPPIHFVLSVQDDKNNPDIAPYVARYFALSHAIGVIGHWTTGPALAAAPIYETASIAQIHFNPTASEYTQHGFKTAFRILGSTDQTALYLAESAASVLNGKRIAVIHNDTPFSLAVSQAFVRNIAAWPVQVVQQADVSATTSDFNVALRGATDSAADVIFFGAITGQLNSFVQAAQRGNTKASVLLIGGATDHTLSGNDQVYALEPDIPADSCRALKAFRERFSKRFGTAPTSFSWHAYDAASLLIHAARQADAVDPVRILPVLRSIHHNGLSSKISFDPAGNVLSPSYTLYQSVSGSWKKLKIFHPKAASAACPS